MNDCIELDRTHTPQNLSDWIARGITRFMRFFADAFFKRRYGHRAVVLETVAAVPGMVGSTLQHLKSLRHMSDDQGWIRVLMDEAENERMHLLTFIEIARPTRFERWLIILAQGVFYNGFFLLYLISPRTASSAISKRKRLPVTLNTSPRSRPVTTQTCPRRSGQSRTGIYRRMRGWRT